MIIVRLNGGLGNQMFQYAAGRAIAYRNNTNLKLDISSFEQYTLRSYSLDCFNIIEDFATHNEIKRLKPDRSQLFSFGLNKLQQKIMPWHNHNEIIEHTIVFNPDVRKITGNAYLDGYWQSEKYFADIAHIIWNDFTFKYESDELNTSVLSQIQDADSVSLHIRRGDYVSNPKTMETHGVLGIDYYIQALNLIEKKVKDPHIYVFSDDISWARENLNTNLPLHFIDHNGVEKNYEDLRLMNSCKHHIIANSSFSWWGAWLDSKQEKIVIAPRKWFNQSNMDTTDLIPDSWYKI